MQMLPEAVGRVTGMAATGASSARSFDCDSPAGSDIATPIPDGYRMLTADNTEDRQILVLAEQLNVGKNRVLALFAKRRESGADGQYGHSIDSFGAYLASHSTEAQRVDLPRGEFVKRVVGGAVQSDLVDTLARKAGRRVANAVADTTLREPIALGLLAADDDAAYLGVLQKYVDDKGGVAVMASVGAVTLIHGRVVTVNLAAPCSDDLTVELLLTVQRRTVRELMAAN